jgi:hypothetical protein
MVPVLYTKRFCSLFTPSSQRLPEEKVSVAEEAADVSLLSSFQQAIPAGPSQFSLLSAEQLGSVLNELGPDFCLLLSCHC